MRLGLIGTGKQGQRYLLEKNGGRHITVSGSRRIPLDDVDGVIIATHPAGHKELALECIERGLPVLIEKPLALTLDDCETVLSRAQLRGVQVEVAHTHLWSRHFQPLVLSEQALEVRGEYASHDRDYSAWLDWGPHLLAIALQAMPRANGSLLRASVSLTKGNCSSIQALGAHPSAPVCWTYKSKPGEDEPTPMATMMRYFRLAARGLDEQHWKNRNDFNRRVYRALFAE